ncbi:major facilitator superfamily domain-containing protein [Aspergillus avenaceus]|uniref:Major facilitator superfamily domain-containing protein n=1 Tax=Aspergillus avenaceus TaxID=36643 RepID=A0A5N6U0V5_ASPAV|nr:major facilitator superfamily domain-containing protein [Aspergillus avenaceus]
MHTVSQHNPRSLGDFSPARKYHIVLTGTLFTFNSALGSSLPAGAKSEISSAFSITSDTLLVLLNSLYLVGFSIGPLIFGPLSEYCGRRPVLLGTYIGYTAFTLGRALSPNYAALLVFRLLCGLNAAAPNAVLGGLYSDIYKNPRQRGIAMGFFMFMTALGPEVGPIISGFVSVTSWRWTFWAALIIAGAGLPTILMLPETYAPVLARKRIAKEKDTRIQAAEETWGEIAQEFGMVFTRPFVMVVQEPILLFSSLYLALVYAILYLFFQAYPIIFQGLYNMSPGVSGLAFIPIMIGAGVAFLIFLWYTNFHDKATKANRPWAKVEEYRRLPLACGGAPTIVIALFWLGWASYKSVHPIVPMIAGLWFGIGYLLIFIAMLNYLTDAYKENSASAQAAASTVRSVTAVCLPLATDPMYSSLGIHWASSLLGFIALGMAVIPFVFIRYGEWIREKSRFCRTMEEDVSVEVQRHDVLGRWLAFEKACLVRWMA